MRILLIPAAIVLLIIIASLPLLKADPDNYQIFEDSKLIGYISSMALSPDSQLLVIGTNAGRLYLFQRNNLTLLKSIKQHSKSIGTVKFSADGERIMSLNLRAGEVGIWKFKEDKNKLKNIQPACIKPCHTQKISSFIHPSKDTVYIQINNDLYHWSALDEYTLELDKKIGRQTVRVNASALSPSGKFYLTAMSNKTVEVRETETMELHDTIQFRYEIKEIVFSPTGKYMATLGRYKNFAMTEWNEKNQKYEILYDKKSKRSFENLIFSPDESLIAVGNYYKNRSNDRNDKKEINIYLSDSGEEQQVIVKQEPYGKFEPLKFSRDNNYLFSSSRHDHISIWDLLTHKIIIDESMEEINTRTAVIADDNTILMAKYNNNHALEVYHPLKKTIFETHGQRRTGVLNALISQDKQKLFLNGASSAHLINLHDSKLSLQFEMSDSKKLKPVFSPDSRYLALTIKNQTKIWDLTLAKLILKIPGPKTYKFSDNGRKLIITKHDGTSHQWDIASKTRSAISNDGIDDKPYLSTTPDGKYLVYGKMTGGLDFIDAKTNDYSHASEWSVYERFEYKETMITNLEFTNNSKYVISVSHGGMNILWNIADGKYVRDDDYNGEYEYGYGWDETANLNNISPNQKLITVMFYPPEDNVHNTVIRILDAENTHTIYDLVGHEEAVTSFAYSPDSKYLATGGEDSKIIIWDLTTGGKVHIFKEHQSVIKALLFTDNKQLISASNDGTVRFWNIDSAELNKTITMLPDRHWIATHPKKLDYVCSKINDTYCDKYMSIRTDNKLMNVRKLSEFRKNYLRESILHL